MKTLDIPLTILGPLLFIFRFFTLLLFSRLSIADWSPFFEVSLVSMGSLSEISSEGEELGGDDIA